MLVKQGSAVLVIFLLCDLLAGGVKLEWKLKKGQEFIVRTVEKETQTLKVRKAILQENTLTTISRFAVVEATKDRIVLDYKIESVKLKTDSPTAIDKQLIKRMQGSTFRITLAPDGRVSKFDGFEAFLTRISDGDPELRKTAASLLNKETMKNGANHMFAFLPTKKVGKGDTWQRSGLIPLGPLGSFKTTEQYTLDATQNNRCRINYQARLVYQRPKSNASPLKVVGGNLKAKTASGTFLFDVKKGRLVKSTRKLELEGKLIVEVAKMKIPTEIHLVRTTEHGLEPARKKKP